MGAFINYSLHFVERCSIKVQGNGLNMKQDFNMKYSLKCLKAVTFYLFHTKTLL